MENKKLEFLKYFAIYFALFVLAIAVLVGIAYLLIYLSSTIWGIVVIIGIAIAGFAAWAAYGTMHQ